MTFVAANEATRREFLGVISVAPEDRHGSCNHIIAYRTVK
jgi:hypothetical protein